MTKEVEKQIDKFKQAARELEADESEEAFDSILKKVAKTHPERSKKAIRKPNMDKSQ